MVPYLSCLLLDPPGFSWCLSLLIDTHVCYTLPRKTLLRITDHSGVASANCFGFRRKCQSPFPSFPEQKGTFFFAKYF